jgi:hypothetical protein
MAETDDIREVGTTRGTLLVRVIYSLAEPGPSELALRRGPERDTWPVPTLRKVAAAVSLTDDYFRSATILSDVGSAIVSARRERGLRMLRGAGYRDFLGTPHRVVSIEMRSPLSIVVELPPEAWIAMAGWSTAPGGANLHVRPTRQ